MRKDKLVKVFPLSFISAGSLYLLFVHGISLLFLGYLLLLPAVFSITVVRVARRLKFWEWAERSWVPTLVWCGYGMLGYVLTIYLITKTGPMSIWLELAVVGGVVWAMIGTLFDIFAMEAGVLTVYNRAYRKNLGAIQSVGSYGFFFFGVYGVISSLLAKLGSFLDASNQLAALAIFAAGIIGISLPFLLYLWALNMKRRKPE